MSIRQDLPTTCHHRPATQDLSSHPTQREEEVKVGEKERKRKKQDIDVKHAAHNNRDEMKETREKERTLQHSYSDCDD